MQIPKFRSVIRLGWVFLIPLSILVYTLMIENWEAGKAGMVAVIGVLVVGALQKETRPSFKKIVAAFEETGKTLARYRRHHRASRHRHRRAPSIRLHVQDFALAGHSLRQQHLSCFYSSPLSAVCSSACRCRPPSSTSRLPSWPHRRWCNSAFHRWRPILFLFYFGMVSLITPPDCLPVYIAAIHRPRELLANRLDRHAPRHRRLHRSVHLRASSSADIHRHGQRDRRRHRHRQHRRHHAQPPAAPATYFAH